MHYLYFSFLYFTLSVGLSEAILMFVWQYQFQFSIIMAVKQKHLPIIKLILV